MSDKTLWLFYSIPMNFLAAIDQILDQIETATPKPGDPLLGLPPSLTGIELQSYGDRLQEHQNALQKTLGRDVHPAVALLDLIAADGASAQTGTNAIDEICLLTKHALRDLIQAALYDNLTGLYSRNILESRLKEEFGRARRYNLPLSVLFIDIDSFKTINDTYGHAEGDRVLSYIGRFIQNHLREVDFPVRYGGEEFVVILPHTSGKTALSLAQRLHHGIGEGQKKARLRARVTLSIGVGTLVSQMVSADHLIDAADQAVYKAKIKKDMVWPTVNADPHGEKLLPEET